MLADMFKLTTIFNTQANMGNIFRFSNKQANDVFGFRQTQDRQIKEYVGSAKRFSRAVSSAKADGW